MDNVDMDVDMDIDLGPIDETEITQPVSPLIIESSRSS